MLAAARAFSLGTLGLDQDKLKKGGLVWVVPDGDSLIPVTPAAYFEYYPGNEFESPPNNTSDIP